MIGISHCSMKVPAARPNQLPRSSSRMMIARPTNIGTPMMIATIREDACRVVRHRTDMNAANAHTVTAVTASTP